MSGNGESMADTREGPDGTGRGGGGASLRILLRDMVDKALGEEEMRGRRVAMELGVCVGERLKLW